jgi:hypothetical protein
VLSIISSGVGECRPSRELAGHAIVIRNLVAARAVAG